MAVQSRTRVQVYDEFEGPQIDAGKWLSLPLPLPDGSVRKAVERSAVTVVQDGTLSVTVDTFEYSHDTLQAADNAKHMLLSTGEFALPPGRATFSIRQAATRLGHARAEHPMLAVAAFNVIDVQQGLVFDILSSGSQVFAVHEQLAGAPRPAGPPYTHVVHEPFAPVDVSPAVAHLCAIEFDAKAKAVRWFVNDAEIYRVAGVPWPERVVLGLALMSGVRLRDGRSTSIRGQGLRATWSAPSVDLGDR